MNLILLLVYICAGACYPLAITRVLGHTKSTDWALRRLDIKWDAVFIGTCAFIWPGLLAFDLVHYVRGYGRVKPR